VKNVLAFISVDLKIRRRYP